MGSHCCPFVSVLAVDFSLYCLVCYCWRVFNNFIPLKALEVLLRV